MSQRQIEIDISKLKTRQEFNAYTIFVLAAIQAIFHPSHLAEPNFTENQVKLLAAGDQKKQQEAVQPIRVEATTHELKPVAIAMLGRAFDRFRKKTGLANNPHRSEHSLWRTDLYAKRATKEGVQSVIAAMHVDARHHALENLLCQLDTYYSYTLENGLILGEGYNEDLIVMAGRFIEAMAKKGKQLTRADLEEQILILERQWALQAATLLDQTNPLPKQYTLTTSPPGSNKDGYYGIDSEKKRRWHTQERHHTFFYLKWAEKSTDGKIIIHTRQIRAWPNIGQLIRIQTALNNGQAPKIDPKNPTFALIENILTFNNTLTPDQMVDYISQTIYQTQDTWAVKPNELPQLDEIQFFQEQQTLFTQFYLAEVEPLLAQIPDGLPKDDPYWSDGEYKKLLAQLDKAFTYYARALAKWVENHNTNPLFKVEKPGLKQLVLQATQRVQSLLEIKKCKHQSKVKNDNSTNPSQTTQVAPYTIPVEQVRRLFQIDINQTVLGKTVNAQDRKWYKQNVGGLISISGRLFSLAQCGILAPFTAPLSIMKASGSMSNFKLNVSLLSSAERLKLRHEIQQQAYNEITLNGQKWMVPQEYLKIRDNGRPGCLVQNGIEIGPCDIPLASDPMTFNMNKFQFNQYLSSLNMNEPLHNAANQHNNHVVFDRARDQRPYQDKIKGNESYSLTQLFAPPEAESANLSDLIAPQNTVSIGLGQLLTPSP